MRRTGRTAAGLGGVVVLVLALVALLWTNPGRPEEAVPPADPSATATAGPGSTAPVPPRDQDQVGTDVDPQTGLEWVALETLPPEAAETVELVERGGPYPYRQDGAVFNNFEGLLPEQRRGYYREYTVPTPGEDDRGARRVVTGADDTVFFWTADHYESFQRIAR